MSKIVKEFTILSSNYNDFYNFLDITIPRTEFTKWLEINHEILNLTAYSSTWSSSINDCIRIWIYDKETSLNEYDILQKNKFLNEHNLLVELNLTISDVFNLMKEKINETCNSCMVGINQEKKSIEISFYTNKENALLIFKTAKSIYTKHYLGIECLKKGCYKIYISKNKDIEIFNIDKPKIIGKVKSPNKKIELTLEEIAKKFNVDVKDLKII